MFQTFPMSERVRFVLLAKKSNLQYFDGFRGAKLISSRLAASELRPPVPKPEAELG
jgi:hypothetical protein